MKSNIVSLTFLLPGTGQWAPAEHNQCASQPWHGRHCIQGWQCPSPLWCQLPQVSLQTGAENQCPYCSRLQQKHSSSSWGRQKRFLMDQQSRSRLTCCIAISFCCWLCCTQLPWQSYFPSHKTTLHQNDYVFASCHKSYNNGTLFEFVR